jgi:transcriptional regulator with PAS, ATPase and Fis domain
LHEKSERASFPLIEVNCAIPSELIESELFGHVKELYLGGKDRAGKFEATIRYYFLR